MRGDVAGIPARTHNQEDSVLKRIAKVGALTSAGLLLAATAATAHPGHTTQRSSDGAIDNPKSTHDHHDAQHDGDEGHLDPVSDGFDLISKLRLERVGAGRIADVAVHNGIAYLGARGSDGRCKNGGVHVVDISDVADPTEIGFIPAKAGSYPGEGVQALSVSTAAFTGDLLVTNNETCKSSGVGGLNLYDVTNPATPVKLVVGFGDTDVFGPKQANDIHSVFAWQSGDRAYAVMVDNVESTDVDIVDITDPRKPVLIAEYDLNRFKDAGGRGMTVQEGLDEIFLHDMVVKEIEGRQIMLLSYWDGGYVQLDVTDPMAPTFLADSDFPTPDTIGAERGLTTLSGDPVPPEGNAHYAEFTRNNRFVIGADEDFAPYATVAENTSDESPLTVSSGSGTRNLEPGDEVTGDTVFVGRACNGDARVPTASDDGPTIAVAERGVCTFTEKVANVQAAGYEAVIIFNRTGSDACNSSLGMSVEGDIYAFGVAPREQGYALFDTPFDEAACESDNGTQQAPIAIGAVGDSVTFGSYFDGWGYVRLFDAGTMEEIGAYAIPEAHDEDFAQGFGDLSVHEVATSQVRDDLAFLSYYSGGARAITVGDEGITEIAAFIDEGGNNFWGVEVFQSGDQEYVALSDRDFGLYILRLSDTP
jgi:hypothetical protein